MALRQSTVDECRALIAELESENNQTRYQLEAKGHPKVPARKKAIEVYHIDNKYIRCLQVGGTWVYRVEMSSREMSEETRWLIHAEKNKIDRIVLIARWAARKYPNNLVLQRLAHNAVMLKQQFDYVDKRSGN